MVYLDLLCWTVLAVPWLFLGASTCVWMEITRTIGEGEIGGLPLHCSDGDGLGCGSLVLSVWSFN